MARIEQDQVCVQCLSEGRKSRTGRRDRTGLSGDQMDVLSRLVESVEVLDSSGSRQRIDQEPVPSPGGDDRVLEAFLRGQQCRGNRVTAPTGRDKKRLHKARFYGLNSGIVH
jgi:hypothetical protein